MSKKVHMLCLAGILTRCGGWYRSTIKVTWAPEEVTCKSCLKSLKSQRSMYG